MSPDPLSELAPVVLEHFNEEHSDSVLFVARVLGGRPGLTSAVATAADTQGLDLRVDGDSTR
jgi:hypothetical protein